MLVEVLTMLKAGLDHGQYGVNVQCQKVPTVTPDKRPRAVARVLSPISSDTLHQGNLGTDRPLLVISNPRPFDIQGEHRTSYVDTAAGQGMEVIVAYITENNALKSARGLRETWYTMRSIARAMRAMFENANAADRVLNGVQMRDLLEVTLYPTRGLQFEGVKDVLIAGAVVLRIGVRDEEPVP